jgi:hypothetical protein
MEGTPRSFMKVIGGPLNDHANAIVATPDGGFVIAGSTTSYGAGRSDVYVVKTSAAGDLMWSRAYGGTNDDEARDVILVEDGGFLVVGRTLNFGPGSWNVYALRLDSQGDTLWTRAYGTAGWDEASAVVRGVEGGFLIGGASNVPAPGGADFEHYFVRIDDDGDTLWTKTLPGGRVEICSTLVRLADGYLAGGTVGAPSGNGPVTTNPRLLRLDLAGRSTASNNLVSFDGSVNDLVPLPDGRLVAVGMQKKGASFENVMHVRSSISTTTISLDTVRAFGREGGNAGLSGALSHDGGLVILGFSRGFGRNSDFYLSRVDTASGAVAWSRAFGGPNDDVGRGLVIARDGGIVMVGSSSSFVDGVNGSDIMLIKTDANGELRE